METDQSNSNQDKILREIARVKSFSEMQLTENYFLLHLFDNKMCVWIVVLITVYF